MKYFSPEYRAKISKGLRSKECKEKRATKFICVFCKKDGIGYSNIQKYCNDDCKKKHKKQQLERDPIAQKTRNLSANIRLGRGKSKRIRAMIEKALGSECKYCSVGLNIDNISIDHKTPLTSALKTRGKRANESRRMSKYDPKKLKELDKYENLHIICFKCNNRKGEFTHDEYVYLLRVIEKKPGLRDKLLARLVRGSMFYSYRKK